jgi:hypothetical protein
MGYIFILESIHHSLKLSRILLSLIIVLTVALVETEGTLPIVVECVAIVLRILLTTTAQTVIAMTIENIHVQLVITCIIVDWIREGHLKILLHLTVLLLLSINLPLHTLLS